MTLLLDTSVVLWALLAPSRISPQMRERLVDPRHRLVISAASAWEISIKQALGRLKAPHDLAAGADTLGAERLAITFEHAGAAGMLPPHHRDPFDRMLVAQAQLEHLTIVTADPQISRYDVTVIDA